MISDLYYTLTKPVPPKTFQEQVQEICNKTEPKPLFCELPDDLKLRSIDVLGTSQTYNYTSSMASLATIGTTTTTF